MPDETTILKFRHLLERHDLAQQVFETIKGQLQAKGLMLRQGTIVDATIVSAASSTKSSTGERDPEMHQTRKGNQWYFGMKAHVGVDAESGLMHSLIGTAANAKGCRTPAADGRGHGYGRQVSDKPQGRKPRARFARWRCALWG
jgi:IS5 family transposase